MKGCIRSIAITLASLFLSSGCSLRAVAIRHGEWLVARKLNSAFDFTADHYKELRVATKEVDQKIRRKVLPQVAATLHESSQRFDDGIDEKDVQWINEKVLQHRQSVADIVAPAIAPLVTRLTAHEIKHFTEHMREENHEVEELAKLSAADFRLRQVKNLNKTLKFWVSVASDERLEQLAIPFQNDLTSFERRLDRRYKSQAAFVQWLTKQQGADPTKVAKEIQRWAKEPYWFVPQASELGMNEWLNQFWPKLLAFDKLLNPSERKALQKSLEGLADDLMDAAKS